MAIVVESFSQAEAGIANPATLSLAKPTGLAVGNYLVAVIGMTGALNTVPSGFVEVRGLANTGSGLTLYTYAKIADAGDVAASNFDFVSAAGASMVGGLLRISGFYPTTPVDESAADQVDANATPTYGIGVTPTYASSLLIYCIMHASTGTITDFAVTTDNPTWTSIFNEPHSGGGLGVAVATATRTAITATGNATATIGGAVDSVGIMIVLNPIQNATVSPAVISTIVSVQAPTVQVGVVMTPAVITATVSIQAPTVEIKTEWTAESKSAAPTWTNQTKNL